MSVYQNRITTATRIIEIDRGSRLGLNDNHKDSILGFSNSVKLLQNIFLFKRIQTPPPADTVRSLRNKTKFE